MANIKNFGIIGVGSDVQFGKGGARFQWDGTTFKAVAADGSTAVRLRGGTSVGSEPDSYVTRAELDGVSAGIIVKGAVETSTSSALSGASWTGGNNYGGNTDWADADWQSGGTQSNRIDDVGVFTDAPMTISGYTVSVGDRVLVRHEGIDFTDPANPTVNANAERNGIYVVTDINTPSSGLCTMRRATDFGGDLSDAADGDTAYQRNSDTVRFGDYTFVTDGDNAGDSFVLSNVMNLDPSTHKDPDLNVASDHGYIVFLLFNEVTPYTADNGVTLSSNNFSMDIDSLSDGTTTLTSTIAFGDGVAGAPDSKDTLGDIFNTHNVVYGLADYASDSDPFVVRTGEDSYTTTSIVASTTGGEEGITIDTSNIGSTGVTVGLDIDGLTDTAVSGTEEIALSNGTNNIKRSLTNIINDLDIVTATSNGLIARTADDTYASRTIVASTTGGEEGLTVTNGDGVSGNPTVGLDINGMTAETTASTTDVLAAYTTNSTANRKVTVQQIIDLANAQVATNQISQGDSSVVVTDTGTGTITITVDGSQIGQYDSSGLQVDSIGADDLGSTQVVLGGGSGGKLNSSGNLTFNGSTLSVTGGVSASGQLSGDTIAITSGGTISGSVSYGTLSGGSITATGLDVNGTTTLDGTTTVSTGNTLTVTDLGTTNGAIVYATSAGTLSTEAAFSYDEGTNTLTVDNLNVTNYGLSVGTNELAFGDSTSGNITSSTAFTVDSTTSTLSIGTLDIGGGSSQTITGTATDADINIVPNGTGEVVIGSSGNAVISSDSGNSMTLEGSTDLNLVGNAGGSGGSVYIKEGSLTTAQFDANTGATTWLTFKSDTATNGPSIGTSGSADIKLVLTSGYLVKVSDVTQYNSDLANNTTGDALVTKKYVDDAIVSGAAAESVKTVIGTVDLSSNGTTNLNVNGGSTIPANAIVMEVKVNVTTADSAATLEIGDGTTSGRYMSSSENDPSSTGIYVADVYDNDTSAVQLVATVASTNGDAGASANVMVTYRVPA